MSDADTVRDALERLPWTRENVDAVKALDRLEALSRVHVTQASRDLLVAEGWLDPEQVKALEGERDRLAEENDELRKNIARLAGALAVHEHGDALRKLADS